MALRRIWLLAAGLSSVVILACARPTVPDPRAVVQSYAEALVRGDAERVYGLMTAESRRTYGRSGTEAKLREAQEELGRQGRSLLNEPSETRISATVRFVDGEHAVLVWERGRLGISLADALPYGARTPEQALASLRAALARRSYSALVRVLTSNTRGALEGDLRSLVEGLKDPESLDVRVHDDEAEVEVPGGHSVRLRREAGIWRIRDID